VFFRRIFFSRGRDHCVQGPAWQAKCHDLVAALLLWGLSLGRVFQEGALKSWPVLTWPMRPRCFPPPIRPPENTISTPRHRRRMAQAALATSSSEGPLTLVSPAGRDDAKGRFVPTRSGLTERGAPVGNVEKSATTPPAGAGQRTAGFGGYLGPTRKDSPRARASKDSSRCGEDGPAGLGGRRSVERRKGDKGQEAGAAQKKRGPGRPRKIERGHPPARPATASRAFARPKTPGRTRKPRTQPRMGGRGWKAPHRSRFRDLFGAGPPGDQYAAGTRRGLVTLPSSGKGARPGGGCGARAHAQ